MRHNYQGAITALVTPFTADGQIDEPALRRLVAWQIESGIDGLVPCGSTGEAMTLSEEEYRLVVATVVGEVAGRVPVIAGAGSNDTRRAVHLSRIAQEAGADALLHVTPYYNKPTSSGLIVHFATIADSVDLPIIAYNVPGRTGSNVSAQLMLRLAKEVPQVVGVKEASGDLNQIMEIIAGAPKDFTVLSGDDALTLPTIALGGKGVISVVANEIPTEFGDMVRAALASDWAKARELHYRWLNLMSINFLETNPIPVKTALGMMGLVNEVFRLPLTPMAKDNRDALQRLLERHGLV
jgi:4-hydroxy-tetrahydrodipicolinate synthase